MLGRLLGKQKQNNIKIRAYKRLFETEDGQVVLKDLLKSCHFMSSTFSGDPYESAYRDGERAVLMRIIRTINIDPEQLLKQMKMITEQENLEETE